MKKHVFIDMDGTIACFNSPENNVIISDWGVEGLFIKREPIQIVINGINQIFKSDEKYILSAYPHEVSKKEKDEWLDKYFPLESHRRFYVPFPDGSKADFIMSFCIGKNIKPSDCILIDDEFKHLAEAEKLGIESWHVSRLICEYEKRNR